MRREARLLHEKSLDSLFLAIEHFNRPSDRGRPEAVLILLDRTFELLLKSAILHRGGRIRERRARETIGFEKAVRKCLDETPIRFLSGEEALTIQMINSLRDAAQHYLVELSEQQLYLHCQAGVTLFRELQERVFGLKLDEQLPARVLPITTSPPQGLESLMNLEFEEIKNLLKPGRRRAVQARAKLRAMAILDASLSGDRSQPSEGELNKMVRGIQKGTKWADLFPGIATLDLSTDGTGLNVSVRLVKKSGQPVHLVPEGTPGATVVAVQKVDKLGFFNLGLHALADKLNLSPFKALAIIRYLKLQQDADCYSEFQIGSQSFKRYSSKALDMLKKRLPELDVEAISKTHGPRRKAVEAAATG